MLDNKLHLKTWQKSAATVVGCLLTTAVTAQVLAPGSRIAGGTYGDWSEEWWQWAYSMPFTANPLFDNADVSTGQRGKVWFLGGSFTGTATVRTGVIPGGKMLFFPIVNTMIDDTDCANGQRISDGLSPDALRAILKPTIDGTHDLSCTVDGVEVSGLNDPISSPYRVQTPSVQGFSYSIPGENSLNVLFGYPCWASENGSPVRVSAKVYHAVGDGVYIMLAPLSPGAHEIHIYGAFATGGTQDIVYNLTVLADDTK